MYNNSKKILALLLFLILGEALAMGIVFGIPNQELIGTNSAGNDPIPVQVAVY